MLSSFFNNKKTPFNMKLENQVTSLELSKQLKEAGVPQESLFVWHEDRLYWRDLDTYYPEGCGEFDSGWTPEGDNNFISAFTCSELGGMLPIRYIDGYKLEIDEDNDKIVRLWNTHTQKVDYEARAKTEVDARGQMLLYLKKQKLI